MWCAEVSTCRAEHRRHSRYAHEKHSKHFLPFPETHTPLRNSFRFFFPPQLGPYYELALYEFGYGTLTTMIMT